MHTTHVQVEELTAKMISSMQHKYLYLALVSKFSLKIDTVLALDLSY